MTTREPQLSNPNENNEYFDDGVGLDDKKKYEIRTENEMFCGFIYKILFVVITGISRLLKS